MGFAAGALKGLTEPILRRQQEDEALSRQIRQMIAQTAMQGLLDPATDPVLRDQYRRFLASDPNYQDFAGLTFPDTPQAKLSRELGPLLMVAQAAGALGQAGLMTPERGAQLETIAGQRVFPRTQIPAETATVPVPPAGALEAPKPGQQVPTQQVTFQPAREEIDVGRFAPSIRVKLFTGQEMGLDELKGLPSDMVMYLLRGPNAVGVKTYGDLFPGNALKPEWKSVPVQVNDDGRLVFPPAHAFLDPAAQQPSRTLGQVFGAAVRPEFQNAPATYDARGQLQYPPSDVFVDVDAQRFERARMAWVTAKAAGKSDEDAYRLAFAEDPKFPKPATLPTPQDLSPQQQAWSKFFTGGYEALTGGERAYVESQLRENIQDPRFRQAMQTVATLSLLRERQDGKLSTSQEATFNAALAIVAEAWGVEPTTLVKVPLARWQQLWNRFAPGFFDWRAPTKEVPVGQTQTEQAWARQQFETFRSKGGAKTKQAFQREFNRARRHPELTEVPLAYWRALQALINDLR